MMEVYVTRDGRLHAGARITDRNSWVMLVAPSDPELGTVSGELDIPEDLLRAALDEEEQPRLEFDGRRVLVLLRCPVSRGDGAFTRYETLPLGVVVTPEHVVTVCLEANEVLDHLVQQGRVHTAKRTLFLLQVLYRVATQFLRFLRQIDRRTEEIERALHQSMRNEELIRLLELQKSLVYFSTSLRANQIVMDRLLRMHLRADGGAGRGNGGQLPVSGGMEGQEAGAGQGAVESLGGAAAAQGGGPGGAPVAVLRLYEEDREFLEDVITENRQALEMADIYSANLSNTMDAFASIISNNLNIVMKFLTSVTIVLALPTIVASLYGMNVPLPLQHSPLAFPAIVAGSAALAGAAAWLLSRRGMF